MASEYGSMLVTSSGYLYPVASQKWAYETALAIKDNKKNYDPDARKILWDHHILSEDEVRAILVDNGFDIQLIDSMIDATGQLAEHCQAKITLWQALFPNYDTPADIQELYNIYRDSLMEG
jgi:DNA polymerase III alpha subunit